MPDIINANGLQVKTATEITSALDSGVAQIYGADSNVDQNSPDGQMIGILTQMAVDIRELAVEINAGFDPDQAIGAILDQRVTINHISRQGGTYTIQPIDIVVSSVVTLQGLDASFPDPNGTGYTVQDGSGNQFILSSTVTLIPGTYPLNFRAKQVGNVNVTINTINIPVTVVLGVMSVNNNSAALTIGQNQETDAQLRTRRQQSPAISSNGYLNGLLAKILALTGVTEASLYENVTSSIDANGIPAHGMWLIVAGGSSADIANVIYRAKSAGANMKGDISFNITTISGALFVAMWDVPAAENLYIRFTILTTTYGFTFNQDTIAQYIVDNLKYNIGDLAETSLITDIARDAIASQGGGGVPIAVAISNDNVTFSNYLNTNTLKHQWTLDPSRIYITVTP